MKSTTLMISVTAILIFGGVIAYTIRSNSDNQIDTALQNEAMMEKTETEAPEEAAMMKEEVVTDEAMMESTSRYTVFSPEALASVTTPRTVLYFYANWCPTCKVANEDFTDNDSEIPTDLSVIRVNYADTDTDEAEKALAKKYGITYQHTFVQIDDKGNEITKWNGGGIEELVANIK
ncbi:MAG: hypothetical protein COY80_02025 [Candidatus Pacebacteria bacterium CG_4_10_14_0_8_um_filter_42_14]|nr:MAG: hypothetical protein COY80_02025 [Candidatus Pacebacteria bacterium CG_4_10_14_0_8_um_filter_42_14]